MTFIRLRFSSACTGRRRGKIQLSVSSKVGGLERGHPLSSEGVCHGVAPSTDVHMNGKRRKEFLS